MSYIDKSCSEFAEILAAGTPVPGGGSAAALAGAVGTALGNMVGSLTTGKKKYAHVEDHMYALMEKAEELRVQLLELVDKDAEAFAPLAKAYGMPKDTPEQREEKRRVMEECLKLACSAPLEIMEKCGEAIDLHKEFAAKGNSLAVSDAGVGAVICRAALKGASLNVYVNTKLMHNRELADEYDRRADMLIEKYSNMAEDIFEEVREEIRR